MQVKSCFVYGEHQSWIWHGKWRNSSMRTPRNLVELTLTIFCFIRDKFAWCLFFYQSRIQCSSFYRYWEKVCCTDCLCLFPHALHDVLQFISISLQTKQKHTATTGVERTNHETLSGFRTSSVYMHKNWNAMKNTWDKKSTLFTQSIHSSNHFLLTAN